MSSQTISETDPFDAEQITPRLIQSPVPLSFAQQQLWFLHQLEPGNPFYNIHLALRLSGSLQVKIVERSLNALVLRHESLHTTFHTKNGRPVQIVEPVCSIYLPLVELNTLPAELRLKEALRLAQEDARSPFDLEQGPLLRVTIVRLDKHDHLLLLTMHHIVSDGWSTGIFMRELRALYNAFVANEPAPLPELPVQYADFALWQRQRLQSDLLIDLLGYWEHKLAGMPATLVLPTDHHRPAAQSYQGKRQELLVPAALTEALRRLCQREGVTLFMLLLASFQTLLLRYTGQEDIVVGTPVAMRGQPETENIIGFLINTLVLRTDLSGNPTFKALLKRVRETTLEAFLHQEMPFELLVAELQPERNLSHSALVQVMFVLQNAQITNDLSFSGLSLTRLPIEIGTAKFDITFDLVEAEQEIGGAIEYNTDLFEPETIARLREHWLTLLAGIVSSPTSRLIDLPLVTEAERHQLLVEWNDVQKAPSEDLCLHTIFEMQAVKTPDRVAVSFHDQQLTYADLNRRANQLAHYLRDNGVGPDVLVGLCMERSVELSIGILGILKAGGGYVPLDPAYPQNRLSFLIEDTQMPLLLTQQQLMERIPQQDVRVLCLDTEWMMIESSISENFEHETVSSASLAYVIYTSGSTGTPKGVMVTHANVVRLFTTTHSQFRFTNDDTWTLFHSYAFDFSVWEFWGALLYGGRLVVVPMLVSRTPEAFYQLLVEQQVTVLNQTPSAFVQLIQADENSKQHREIALRYVIFGGEALDPQRLRPWVARHGDAHPQLINMYGITETTVHVTYHRLTERDLEGTRGSVIGRPLRDLQVYILDERRNLVPIGVAGEIYVGGAGLARGYLKRPALTGERFIVRPFSNQPGARLYKSGDRARYLADGTMEYLGRIDEQVKVRGYRIELGEIEMMLGQHPQIRACVVIVHEEVAGDKRLVAYLTPQEWDERVPDPPPGLASGQLRKYLQDRLPDYMVPSLFVVLRAFPLTTNGKVDRRALPAPDGLRPELEETFVAPRTMIESKLAQIWAKVLRLEKVGVRDNFFELGGDSILCMQIVARANQEGVHLTPRQFFQHQTIEALSIVADATPAPAIQAEQGLVVGPVPLTAIQRWFFSLHLPEPHHWNQVTLLEVPDTISHSQIQQVLNQIIVHHDALRLRFTWQKSEWRQINAGLGESVPSFQVDLSALSPDEQNHAMTTVEADAQASLNLAHGPLLSAVLFHLGVHRPRLLLIIIHHLAVDGVSWRVLLEDLHTGYQQLSRGEPLQFLPKTTPFKQWAERIVEYAQSEALRRESAYWLQLPWSRVQPLPLDFPVKRNLKTLNIESTACQIAVSLTKQETHALLEEVPQAYQTQINDILLSALVRAFASWTGSPTLLIDLEGHGREDLFADLDLSRTVGWFTSIFPVILDVTAASTEVEALKVVKEQLRSIPNRGIGYGLLRYLCQETSTLEKIHALPQAEVVFNYLGQFEGKTTLPDLSEGKVSPADLLGLLHQISGLAHGPRGQRTHSMEINSVVSGGQLQVIWGYSERLHRRSTIEHLAKIFIEKLRSLIVHCQSSDAGGYTPSDFPRVKLSQEQLDQIFAEIDLE